MTKRSLYLLLKGALSVALALLPPEQCRFDCVALGEVMLRLDPGEGRIRHTRTFQAWEGGGEYNVARGLRRCFGLRTAIVTALVDNEVGLLLEDLMLQGGVDLGFLQWQADDGIGRRVRNGLNFTERGFGVRGALGVSDRGHSAASQLGPGSIDWKVVFGTAGTRWFHTGGIFASLSESTAEFAIEACTEARWHGAIVSYDLNYRPSLWKDRGGGGDSFASGLIYGLLNGESTQTAVNLGAAHGALAMTTPGDNSMALLPEVAKLAAGGDARVVR